MAVVGRVARTHGLKGQFVVNVETDFPAERFRPGARLFVERRGGLEAITIATVRFQRGRPIVGAVGVESVEAATALVAADLLIPLTELAPLPPGTYYRHDLVGCRVETVGGRTIGLVADVEGEFDGVRLVVRSADGVRLVPLAAEICLEIDLAAKRVVVKPPEGLLDLNEDS
jgi:16S rRNA processing protein RimM